MHRGEHPGTVAFFGYLDACAMNLQSYAKRKGMPVEKLERWLGPNLSYDTTAVGAKRLGGNGLP
jgi:hypothetical protein